MLGYDAPTDGWDGGEDITEAYVSTDFQDKVDQNPELFEEVFTSSHKMVRVWKIRDVDQSSKR